MVPQQAAAATPAELQELRHQYEVLSNLEDAVGKLQQRWRWVWGLVLLLVLGAAAGLIAFSWMQSAPTLAPAPSSTSRPATSSVTNEELPPAATASIAVASVPSSAEPVVPPQPVANSTVAVGVNAARTGGPRLLAEPATSPKAVHRQANQAAVKKQAADDTTPATPCSAAALAMALCDIKGR
ncbi:hypothetical protein ACFQAT_01650 [Undibacterium arcticum]